MAVNASSDVTGRDEVLLLRAPSFAEIDAREKAKTQERATVNANDEALENRK